MKKVIIYFSLVALVFVGIFTALHHAKSESARSVLTSTHIEQPRDPAQQLRVWKTTAPKTSSRAQIPGQQAVSAPAKQAALRAFAQLPLDFEANRGQAPANFDFVSHGPGYVLGLSPRVAGLSVQRETKHASAKLTPENLGSHADAPEQIASSALELRLVGASADATASGIGEQSGRSNYFIGNDPAKWQTQVPHFNRVKMAGVYPGVDLDFYGNPQQLEYDFLVSPQANPKNIRLQIAGANRIHLDAAGNAILRTPAGEVQLKRPVSYQEIAGVRKEVESKFKLVAGRELQFELGAYDRSRPLVIDPVLLAAVSLGGTTGVQQSEITDVELDATGNVYVTGYTCSTDFPSTVGPFQNSHINLLAKTCETAVVIKFDPTLSTMFYSDFIGGSNVTLSWYMAIDASGNAFVVGGTNSGDFPTVNNLGRTAPLAPCSLSKNSSFNCPDGFVFKLSPDGSQLLFSELMGGSQVSGAHALEINPVTHELVVIGATNSSDFQPAPTTLQTTFSGTNCTSAAIPCFETFLYGLDANTGAVKYGTFIGGAANNFAPGLAVDNSGGIYVVGSIQPPFNTTLFPVTTTIAPAGGASAGGTDIFAMKLSVSPLNALSVNYLTVIQGEADDAGTAITIDSLGNAYIVGITASQHLAVTPGVFQSTNNNVNGDDCGFAIAIKPFAPNACGSIFIAKLNSTGALSFLTYVGGTGPDTAEAIGLDSLNNIWFGGTTSSATGFPFSADAYPQPGGFSFNLTTPYLAEMSNDGKTVPFATPVASESGQLTGITIDNHDNIFVAGFSSVVPTTPGVYPPVPEEFEPGFVQKWNAGPQPVLQLSSTFLSFPDTAIGGLSPSQTVTITNTGLGTMELTLQLQLEQGVFPGVLASDFIETNNCGTTLASNGSCTATVAFSPAAANIICLENQDCAAGSRTAQILVTTNAPGSPNTISLGGNTGGGAIFSASPNPVNFPSQAAGTSSTPIDVTIENSGDVAMTFSNFAITQVGGTDFTLNIFPGSSKTCTTPTNPSTFCGVEVTFSPAVNATGFRTAQLIFTDTAGGSPQTIQINGTVAGTNALNVSPGSIAIGPVAIGNSGASSLKNVTLSNPTATAVTASVSITTGDTADFSVSKGSCTSVTSFTIAGGASCFVSVIFGPAVGPSGLRTAVLGITSPQITNIPSVPLSAEAVSNTDPVLTFFTVPSPLTLGTIPVGQSSNNSSNFLVIDNSAPIPCAGNAPTCGGPLTVTAITPGTADYILGIPQGAAYCTNPPFTIPAGNGGCTFPIIFSPITTGPRNTSLVITSNDPQGPVSIPLSGNGVTIGIAQLSPQAVIFGNSQIGVVSPTQIVTLQNVGKAAINPGTVAASTNFAVAANNCTTPIPASGTCTVSVTATPPNAGPFSGTLTFTNDAAFGGKQAVSLSGTGASGALLLVSPNALLFGNQPVGTTSLPQTITLTSTGNAPVTLPAGAIRVSADFIISANTCGLSLASSASCSVAVQFQPSPSSPFFEGGSVNITDNAPGNPQSVTLTGNTGPTGSNPTTTTLMVSANSVAAGQPVTFTAKVFPVSPVTRIPVGPILFLDGANTLGSVMVDATGQATFTTSSLTAGNHSIVATYTGGLQFLASTSATVSEVITGGGGPAVTSAAVTSSANPSTTGQSVTFTAAVTSTSAGSPTGTVTFFDNNGTTQLGTGPLNGQAMATFATSTLTQGTHSITAHYGGDANFLGATSTVLTQVVNNAVGVPTISAILPTTATAGGAAFTLTVNGTNFVSGSVVSFGATNKTTTFVSATHVTASIAAADIASGGTFAVIVTNPTPGGGTSNSVNFTANNPVPVLSSISPTTAPVGVSVSPITATGTGFVTGSTLIFNGTSHTGTVANNGTTLTATIAASELATASSVNVSISNPTPGGGASNSVSFVIDNFSVSGPATAVTVTAGQSAMFVLNFAAQGGALSSAVNFSASGLPAGAAASFNPASIPAGSASGATTLTITTTARSAMIPLLRTFRKINPLTLLWTALLALIAFLADRIMRANQKGLRFRATAGLLVLICLLVAGCGSASNGGSSGTPAGTSQITVTATSGAATRTTTVTLTVQ